MLNETHDPELRSVGRVRQRARGGLPDSELAVLGVSGAQAAQKPSAAESLSGTRSSISRQH